MSTSLQFDYGKYRGILISVALFLLLDASVLLLNFYISFEIAGDAVGVNLAGRQRMLSQRMAKTLFVLDSSRTDPAAFNAAYDELLLSKTLFDDTLQAFIQGGPVRGAGNTTVILDAVMNRAGRDALHNTAQLWRPYKNAVDQLIASAATKKPDGELTPEVENALAAAVAMARLHNLPILASMNDLTLSLEEVAASKAKRLRLIQTIGISLAIVNFLFILLHFVRQLRDSDAVIEKARRETTEILDTVNEGLFLIDHKLIIGEQYSAKLPHILGVSAVAGKSFHALLESIINPAIASSVAPSSVLSTVPSLDLSLAETARQYVELLFDPAIKEKLIGDLNPLNKVAVNSVQANGDLCEKYLQFTFARVYQERAISHVLVTVQDISAQVTLAQALRDSRQHNDAQLQMLTSLLHTHPQLLNEFINNSFQCFTRIHGILQQPTKTTQAVRDKAVAIFRELHHFKGEAASLKLDFFENAAHSMEDSLARLRNKQDLTGHDYATLAEQLDKLINDTRQVQQLTARLGQFTLVSAQAPRSVNNQHITGSRRNNGWDHLHDFVQHIALRNGKRVQLVVSGLSEIALAADYAQQLKEICIQLLRNAVVHGIETPHDRALSEKPQTGRIDLRLAAIAPAEMELMVMDDGQGLDTVAIRNKAIALGKWSEQEMDGWSSEQLRSVIFHPGFTTAKEVTKDAGRGAGLDLVMQHVIARRGKITVASRAGEFCRFVIHLPIVAPAQVPQEVSVSPGSGHADVDGS